MKSAAGVLKWVSIVGARPTFIKLAPICRAIKNYNAGAHGRTIKHTVIHTGQHYDRQVTDVFFEQMQLPDPDYNLGVGSGSQGTQLAKMIERLEPIFSAEQPDWVIAYGDTNSALASSLLAARMHFRLAHVEAGCRSHDLRAPEEQNRIITDSLSQLLLSPSQNAIENLRREGIFSEDGARWRRVVMSGDITYDALLDNLQLAERRAGALLAKHGVERGAYHLLTVHRAGNTDDPDRLRTLLDAIGHSDMPVLFPVHPRTKNILEAVSIPLAGSLIPIEPLGYLDMLALLSHASKILTDSGGVQKEAFYLGIPCITLRESTEWPETLQLGANRLTGKDPAAILHAMHATDWPDWSGAKPYGDGRTARRILDELLTAGSAEEHATEFGAVFA